VEFGRECQKVSKLKSSVPFFSLIQRSRVDKLHFYTKQMSHRDENAICTYKMIVQILVVYMRKQCQIKTLLSYENLCVYVTCMNKILM